MNDKQLEELMSKRLRPEKCNGCGEDYWPYAKNNMYCTKCQSNGYKKHTYE